MNFNIFIYLYRKKWIPLFSYTTISASYLYELEFTIEIVKEFQ